MKKILFICMLIILFSACDRNYYAPMYHNITTHSKKNELKGNLFVGTYLSGAALNYSITNHFGSFFNINYLKKVKDGGAQMADLGLYAYKGVDFMSKNSKVTFSLAGAYSYGEDYRYKKHYTFDIHRVYSQPSIAITTKFIDLGVSARISRVSYDFHHNSYDFSYDSSISLDNTRNYDVQEYKKALKLDGKTFYFFERSVFIGLGYKGIKLNYHVQEVRKITDRKIGFREGPKGFVSLSLKYDIDKLFKR